LVDNFETAIKMLLRLPIRKAHSRSWLIWR
jgi:hypothetical protein